LKKKKNTELRVRELGELPENAQTLVVLPLIESEGAKGVLDRGIEEILEGQGVAILFLPGVGKLRILDSEKETETLVEKRIVERVSNEDGVAFLKVAMSITVNCTRVAEQEFAVAESIAGANDESQRRRLRDAASTLPGSNWSNVKSSPVSVAVPIPPDQQEWNGLRDGLLCIGLTTKEKTGNPALAPVHFVGTISRNEIDLFDCEFNHILFQEVLRLHGLLLSRLKVDSDLRARRAVTLAYTQSEGPLADALYPKDKLLEEDIILGESALSYFPPSEISVFDWGDYSIVRRILEAAGDRRGSIRLPERWLAKNAASLLESLTGESDAESAAKLIAKAPGDFSILEATAKSFRLNDASAEDWESFLPWVLETFSPDELVDQRILPIIGGDLAAPKDIVFLPPIARGETVADDLEEEDTNDEEGPVDMEGIPSEVVSLLKFLDSSAL
jgi:hypothetical protein